jgi:ApaG protein
MSDTYPFMAETDGVVVGVAPIFLDEESAPAEHRYMWAYRIRIENRGPRTLQLKTRHWRITDRDGRVQEVNGPGVVGQQPTLPPGAAFEYASGVPLSVPSGVMQGSYRLEDADGEALIVRIPLFTLDSPYERRTPS